MILNDFKQNIVQLINNSNLSVEIVYYVLKDVTAEISNLYNQELQKEQLMKEQQKQEGEKKEENNNDVK